MNLIDANAVNDVLKDRISITKDYYLVPDVVDEVELTALTYGKSLPAEIQNLASLHVFDLGIYLKHYQSMLNSHGGRSFFNMTGFGDISTLASIHMLLEVFEIQKTEQLFDPTEPILTFTRDHGLKRRIEKEFSGRNVEVRSIDQLT